MVFFHLRHWRMWLLLVCQMFLLFLKLVDGWKFLFLEFQILILQMGLLNVCLWKQGCMVLVGSGHRIAQLDLRIPHIFEPFFYRLQRLKVVFLLGGFCILRVFLRQLGWWHQHQFHRLFQLDKSLDHLPLEFCKLRE